MRRLAVPLALAAVDVLTLAAGTLVAVLIRSSTLTDTFGFAPFNPVRDYLSLWPALGILAAVRASFALYPGYGLNPAEELRRQTVSSLLVIGMFTIGGTLFRFSNDYSRLVLALAAITMIFVLPPARALAKRILSKNASFGEETWILGKSERAEELMRVIRRQPYLGLRVIGSGLEPPRRTNGIKHCIVIPDDVQDVPLPKMLDELNTRFRRVWLVPNLLDVASVWVTPRDLEGHLALELRNNLLEPVNRVFKRSIELLILALSAPIVVPLMFVLGAVVAADGQGPILFRQKRVGRRGQVFEMLKFRTMRADANDMLQAHLALDPSARLEWEQTQKLRSDPRLTRAGRILRRFSLDELPQLWNVLRGEMSLVGPRAIIERELCLYGERSHLYVAVLPGLTGLWQVSGRSGLSYNDRVRLDSYYVRNWSIWLDLAILARTPLVVLTGRGAY